MGLGRRALASHLLVPCVQSTALQTNPSMMVHSYKAGTWIEKAGKLIQVWGQPGPHNKLWTSQRYLVKPFLKTIKQGTGKMTRSVKCLPYKHRAWVQSPEWIHVGFFFFSKAKHRVRYCSSCITINTPKAVGWRSLWIEGKPDLHRNFQASQSYSLKKKNKQTNKMKAKHSGPHPRLRGRNGQADLWGLLVSQSSPNAPD